MEIFIYICFTNVNQGGLIGKTEIFNEIVQLNGK